MKTTRTTLFVSMIAAMLLGLAFALTNATVRSLPPLRDGDVLFQTMYDAQTPAIIFASHSLYSHVGIVAIKDGAPYVVEAVGPVREIPLRDWLEQGMMGRVTVKRLQGLTPDQGLLVVQAARAYRGLPYDFFFLPGRDAIYCSELAHLAYRDALGRGIGQMERVKDLWVDNFAVRNLILRRWQKHPLCRDGAARDFGQCYDRIMAQELVTPEAVARDTALVTVYSNYGPFQ